jgi:hypothetical protein
MESLVPDPITELFGPPSPPPVIPTAAPAADALAEEAVDEEAVDVEALIASFEARRQGRRSSLYDLGIELEAYDAFLEEASGDVSNPTVERILDRWFEGLEDRLAEKVDGYLGYIKEVEARGKMRKEESNRLAALAKTDENTAKQLRGRLTIFLRARNLKLKTARHNAVSARPYGGPILRIEEKAFPPINAPERFRRVVLSYEYDKDAVRAALEAGEQLDFARLDEPTWGLQIR